MESYSAEIECLLAACRLDPDTNIDRQLEGLSDSFDWELLVKTAFHHGVTGLLCKSLLSAAPNLVPEEITYAADEHLKQQNESNKNQANQLTSILNELNTIGIKAIPFKGMTLAMSTYGNLNLRTSRDLDFLICKEDIQPCIDKLGELGYVHEWNLTPRQWQEFLKYAGEDILYGAGVPVEPHWAFAPSTLAIQVDYAAIWKRAMEVSFNGQPILSLSPEDELIVLCIHGCKEEWAKLKWVVDVAEFIRSHPSISWQILMAYASSQGLARIVKIGIFLAHVLVEIQIPDNVNDWIKKDARTVSMVDRLAEEFFNKDKSNLDIWKPGYFHWSMRERFIDRLRYLLLTISQPRVEYFSDIAIPDRFFFLYWPYRLLHDFIALPVWKLLKRLRPSKKNYGTS